MIGSYKVCSRCVMDTTDPEITFDDNGVCNHCRGFDEVTSKGWFPNQEGARKLEEIVEKIKIDGRGKEYDCIIGLSGGADSSYLALKVKDFGLRPLVVHVDAGWNSELAVQNIECIIKHCNYDLITHVVDWEEMKQLQLAYLKSGVANQDVPQDHVFSANIYHFAVKNKIRYVLNGGNIATESILPGSWLYNNKDSKNLKAIFKKFGEGKLRSYKTTSFFQYYIGYPFIHRMKVVRVLNFMPYNKKEAMVELQEKIGWKSYDRKHGESLFTRFYQNYLLIERYGFDKRIPHLSSLIVSGQITRDDAIAELQNPLYEKDELREDTYFFCKKLGLTTDEFENIMVRPKRNALDFPSNVAKYRMLKKLQHRLEPLLKKRLGNYS